MTLRATPARLLRLAAPAVLLRPDATFRFTNRLVQEQCGFPGPADALPGFQTLAAAVAGCFQAWLRLADEGEVFEVQENHQDVGLAVDEGNNGGQGQDEGLAI